MSLVLRGDREPSDRTFSFGMKLRVERGTATGPVNPKTTLSGRRANNDMTS